MTGQTRRTLRALGAATAATLATAAGAQTSGVSIYGRLDLSVDQVRAGANATASYGVPGASTTRMNDNTSRLGFRGTEELGGGLQALFGVEFGINADAGTLTSPPLRNSYVGLRGAWGTLAAGRLDSTVPTGSPVYSQLARNLRWVVHDAGAVAIGTRILNGNNRVSNAIAYRSPTVGGFDLGLRVNLAGPDAPSAAAPALRSEGDYRQYQAALNYANGPLRGGIGYAADSKRGGLQAGDFHDKVQAVVTYEFDVVRPYAVYGRDRYEQPTATTRGNVDYWLVGASVPVGVHNITANYMQRDIRTDRQGAIRKFQVGYSHNISKRSTLYVFLDNDRGNTDRRDSSTRAVGLGVQHRF